MAQCYHAPEPWCPAGYEAFNAEIMPACVESLAAYYPEDRPPLSLAWRELSDEVQARSFDSFSFATSYELGDDFIDLLMADAES